MKFAAGTACLFALLLLCGCSAGSSYWRNRLDDGADIFTATAGVGFGVKAYAFGLQFDMYNYAPIAALQGGELFLGRRHDDRYHVEEGNGGVLLPCVDTEIFYPGDRAVRRGKAYCGRSFLLPFFLLDTKSLDKAYCIGCSWKLQRKIRELYIEHLRSVPEEKQMDWEEFARNFARTNGETAEFGGRRLLPFERPAWSIYGDVHAAAAVFGGFRFGFNLAEFADFLLGWCCVDILGDDL